MTFSACGATERAFKQHLTPEAHMTKAEAHRVLLRTLTDCFPLRAQRNDGSPPRWIAHERETMHRETNRLRAELGKEPIELSQVTMAEDLATAHADYASKFALYCAELVVDLA